MKPSTNGQDAGEPPANHKKYILIPVGNTKEEHHVPVDDIAHFVCTGDNVCIIYFREPLSKEYIYEIIGRGLGTLLCDLYGNTQFVRVHKSHVVNRNHIHRHIAKDHSLRMKNRLIVPISRGFRDDFFDDIIDS